MPMIALEHVVKTLDLFTIEADVRDPIHIEFMHACRDLICHEMAKAENDRRKAL